VSTARSDAAGAGSPATPLAEGRALERSGDGAATAVGWEADDEPTRSGTGRLRPQDQHTRACSAFDRPQAGQDLMT
jgi:hypothetical protein